MRLALSLLPLLAACATVDGGDADTDPAADSDADTDTTRDDTDDTDVADTDDVGPTCTPGHLGSGEQADAEPLPDTMVTYERVIEACATPDALAGSWVVDVRDEADHRICGFQVDFASTTLVDGCLGCTTGYGDVAWSDATFTDPDLCALFGLDQDFVDGLGDAYDTLGVDVDAEDLVFFDGDDWAGLDQAPETVHDLDRASGLQHLTLTYEETYAW